MEWLGFAKLMLSGNPPLLTRYSQSSTIVLVFSSEKTLLTLTIQSLATKDRPLDALVCPHEMFHGSLSCSCFATVDCRDRRGTLVLSHTQRKPELSRMISGPRRRPLNNIVLVHLLQPGKLQFHGSLSCSCFATVDCRDRRGTLVLSQTQRKPEVSRMISGPRRRPLNRIVLVHLLQSGKLQFHGSLSGSCVATVDCRDRRGTLVLSNAAQA